MAFDYIPLWDRYRELFEPLTAEEVGRLVLAMLDHKDGRAVSVEGNERFVWPSVRRDIDCARAAYEETCRRQRANGLKGGRPRKTENPSVFPQTQQSKGQDNNNDNLNPNLNHRDKVIPPVGGEMPPEAAFVPPTLDEVADYVAQRGSPVDPQAFLDYYEARGWMAGRTPMRDWRAACRSAEKWDRWTVRQGAEDYQPSAERIRENDAWLDRFLAEQETGGTT